jgi:hypothetical protein
MIRIFIPKNKGKQKTAIRGLWKDSRNNLCYDYLEAQDILSIKQSELLNYINIKYIIYDKTTELYWSNDNGWGDKTSATRFSQAETKKFKYLPLNGKWLKLQIGHIQTNQ